MPLTMELLKLSAYAPSAITTGNHIASGAYASLEQGRSSHNSGRTRAVSQTFHAHALVWYAVLLGVAASAGAWILHLTKFLWDVVGERLVFTKDTYPVKVCIGTCQCHFQQWLAAELTQQD